MMNKTVWARSLFFLCFGTLLVLAGCGGGGGGTASGANSNGIRGNGLYSLGGTVAGLPANAAVTLQNSDGQSLAVTEDGAFNFIGKLPTGTNYQVTVLSHTPGVACTVGNGNGTIGTEVVTSVAVRCGAGTVSVLYAFDGSQNSLDGQSPSSTLVSDSSGNLYGTTQGGGNAACACGTVFRVSSTGAYSILHSFAGGTSDGDRPIAGLVIDSAGNLYGTTFAGGAYGLGTVFKLDSAGSVVWRYSFGSATGDGSEPYGGLVMDSTGDLFGTTSTGGAPSPNSSGTIFKITRAGVLTTQYVFAFADPQNDGRGPNGTLVIDSNGYLYGTTAQGGVYGVGTIFKVTTTGSRSWQYSLGSAPGEGQQPNAGLVMDAAGDLYGTTFSGGASGDGTVFKMTDTQTSTPTHTVLYSFDSSKGDGKSPYAALVLDRLGNLYGTNSGAGANNAGTLFKVTPSGAHSVLYSFGASVRDGSDPRGGLLVDSVGNIYGTTYSDGTNSIGTVFKLD